MRRTAGPPLCLLIAMTSVAQNPNSQPSPQSPWSAFAVGSWVVIHTVVTGAKQTHEDRVKMIIVRTKDGQPVVCMAQHIGGKFETRFPTGQQITGFRPPQLGMTLDQTDTDRVQIKGSTYACTTNHYRMKNAKLGLMRTLKLWRTANLKLPYREIIVDRGANIAINPDVVQASYTVRLGDRTTSYQIQVVDTNTLIRVA